MVTDGYHRQYLLNIDGTLTPVSKPRCQLTDGWIPNQVLFVNFKWIFGSVSIREQTVKAKFPDFSHQTCFFTIFTEYLNTEIWPEYSDHWTNIQISGYSLTFLMYTHNVKIVILKVSLFPLNGTAFFTD